MVKNSNEAKKLWDLIKNIEVAMLTTQEGDGTMHSRPMATQQVEFDGYLWFFTHASSHKVDDVNATKQVNVAYVDAEKNRYISISGTARVVRDQSKARELWRPYLRGWFANGVEDPEVAMIKVTVESVDYWDSPASKVVKLFGLLKSVTGGAPPDSGENRTFDFSSHKL